MSWRNELHILENLLVHHPEVEALHQSPGGRVVVSAASPLARILLGITDTSEHPIVHALTQTAPHEIAMLRGLCRGHTLRTLTTTVSLLVYLAEIFNRAHLEEDSEEESSEDGDPLEMPGVLGAPGEEDEEEEESPLAPGIDPTEMVDQAYDEVTRQSDMLDQLGQLLPDMGWGFGRGHLEQALLQNMELFLELLKRADALRQIADELGRLERSKRRNSTARSGREAVVGVHMSGDLSSALPTELAFLGSRSTEDIFYQRYTEHRLLSLELEGHLNDPSEGGSKGPVIACVDTSGSMQGQPEQLAKALILSVMRRVLPKGRRVRLMLFGGKGDFQDMDIGRGPGAMKHFLEFLAMSFHAGTDFDSPLERAMELLEEQRYEQADVLIVTDGYGRASHHLVKKLKALKISLGFEVVSAVIGGSPHGVASFSDRVWSIPVKAGALEDIEIELWDEGS